MKLSRRSPYLWSRSGLLVGMTCTLIACSGHDTEIDRFSSIAGSSGTYAGIGSALGASGASAGGRLDDAGRAGAGGSMNPSSGGNTAGTVANTAGRALTGGSSTMGTSDASGGTGARGGSGSGGALTSGNRASGGTATGGNRASGGTATGGNRASGGTATGGVKSTGATGGALVTGGGTGGGRSLGGAAAAAGTSGSSCPFSGKVSYNLSKAANPTAEQQSAYERITAAMDTAIRYYNCYTNLTKSLNVSYVPSVATADGNMNGSIRFGSSASMNRVTAMHEISHTVGIGTASAWGSFVSNGRFTGSNALAQLLAIPTRTRDTIGADSQHFWPYGLNYESEGQTEADLIGHCQMVMAILKDLGLN